MSLKDNPKRERARAAVAKLGVGKRVVKAEVPAHIHQQLRVHCLKNGVLMRDYIIGLLKEKGFS